MNKNGEVMSGEETVREIAKELDRINAVSPPMHILVTARKLDQLNNAMRLANDMLDAARIPKSGRFVAAYDDEIGKVVAMPLPSK